MNDEHKLRNEQAEMVGRAVSDLMIALTQQLGVPVPVALAAAHAEVIAIMAAVAGNETAAERCESVAELLRNQRSTPKQRLEMMVPHGRA